MRAPGGADRMTERAGSAVDVDTRVLDVEVAHGRHGDRGERLVDLIEVDIARGPASCLSTLRIAPTGAVVNHSGSCAWLA